MGTSVQVKPLCGVYTENLLSYLVSVDGFNFLGTSSTVDGTTTSTPLSFNPSPGASEVFIGYMDFEGRSDCRSIKSVLAHVAPLKLVLVHGSAEATEHLKQHFFKHVCPHVYAPQFEETIDVTSDLCAYKVQLSKKLMSNVLFKKLGDYEVAWVDAVGKTQCHALSASTLNTSSTA